MLRDYFATDVPDIDHPNFAYLLADAVRRFPQRIALRYRSAREAVFHVWDFERLGREVRNAACFMVSRGLKPGDRVALWAENRPEWCVLYLATVISGLTVVPIDALISEQEAIAIARTSGARMICISRKYAEKLADLFGEAPAIETAVVMDERVEGSPAAVEYYSEIVSGSWPAEPPDPDSIPPDSVASIIFTSGTTGLSKGVMLTHHGIIANINASIQSLPIYSRDVFMCVLPLHHTYSTTCSFLSPLSIGASITICEKVVGKVIVKDTRDSGGTVMIAVPLLYDKLKQAIELNLQSQPSPLRFFVRIATVLAHLANARGIRQVGRALFRSLRERTSLASLRLLVAGGGPLNLATADYFDDLGWYIVQGYGMSENGPLITTNTMKYKNNRSAGLVVKNTELRIDEPNADGIGEILVRSPSMMKGYFNNPEATADCFTPDGWLRTGDLGYRDSDGYLFISGRRKNLIVTRGGKNIYPEEIEALFAHSRVIKEIMVVGRKSAQNDSSEEVVAVCVPDLETPVEGGTETALSELRIRELIKTEIASANRMLPAYKKIVDFVVRTEEFEKTSSRKVKRYLYAHYTEPREPSK